MGEQRLGGRCTGSQGLCWLRADVCSLSQERAEVGEEVEDMRLRPETSEQRPSLKGREVAAPVPRPCDCSSNLPCGLGIQQPSGQPWRREEVTSAKWLHQHSAHRASFLVSLLACELMGS